MSRAITQDDIRAMLDELITQARAVEAACYNRAGFTDEQRALLGLDLDGLRDRALVTLSRALLPDPEPSLDDRRAVALEAGAPYLPDAIFNTTPNQLAALAACGVNTDPTR
jgi:hypothetical protein